jgi:predicted small metal-binding protein
MGYSFTCADTGADCPGEFKSSTQEELMQHLQVHVGAAHAELANDPAMAAQVGSLVKQF